MPNNDDDDDGEHSQSTNPIEI